MSISLLYPTRCILCGKVCKGDRLICADCVAGGLIISGKICAMCGVGVEHCSCAHHHNHFKRRIACVYYEGGARRGMSRLKFSHHTMLAAHYGHLMAENVRSKYKDVVFDLVIPVPMHLFDRWCRGFNPAELLAEEIANRLHLPINTDVLYKRRRGKAQKRMKTPTARAVNVLDMFSVRDKQLLNGKTILLVDDVCTTGATLNECAKMLRLFGANKVYAVTFAAAVKGKVQKTLE